MLFADDLQQNVTNVRKILPTYVNISNEIKAMEVKEKYVRRTKLISVENYKTVNALIYLVYSISTYERTWTCERIF